MVAVRNWRARERLWRKQKGLLGTRERHTPTVGAQTSLLHVSVRRVHMFFSRVTTCVPLCSGRADAALMVKPHILLL